MGIKERKEREKKRRRQQIIDAAKTVFSEKGFNKATMEDIAQESELSSGTLYIYFKNKEELYASLMLSIIQYLYLKLEQLKKHKKSDPEKNMTALIATMFDVYEYNPAIIVKTFQLQSSKTLINITPKLREEIMDLSGKSVKVISEIFQEGIKSGVFINKHPVAIADIFWALFSGVILFEESKKLLNQRKDYVKQTLEIAFEIFAKGIKS